MRDLESSNTRVLTGLATLKDQPKADKPSKTPYNGDISLNAWGKHGHGVATH